MSGTVPGVGGRLPSIDKYLLSTPQWWALNSNGDEGQGPSEALRTVRTVGSEPRTWKASWRRKHQAEPQGEAGQREGRTHIPGRDWHQQRLDGWEPHKCPEHHRIRLARLPVLKPPQIYRNSPQIANGSLDGRRWFVSHTGWMVISHREPLNI